MTEASPRDDAIDAYLDALAKTLNVGPARARRILAECGDHLREAAAAREAEGASAAEAARVVVERFGSPRDVARRFAAAEGRLLPASLFMEIMVRSLGVFGVGCLPSA